MEPLRTQAARLSSDSSTSRSEPSEADIAALAKRFEEPLRGEYRPTPSQPAASTPPVAPSADGLPAPQAGAEVQPSPPELPPAPAARGKPGLPKNVLVSAVALTALVPLGLLFGYLWQDTMQPDTDGAAPAAVTLGVADAARPAGLAQPKQDTTPLEVALTSPGRIEADAGTVVQFPITIDATAALPAPSVVAISSLPEGAAFSQGRPDGDGGWRVRPDEIAGLRLRLPAQSAAADMHLELVAGDGTVLSQSQTQVSVAPAPAAVAEVATTGAIERAPPEQAAQAEQTAAAADLPSRPLGKPEVKVNTVKTVTVEPPRSTEPHDGAMALGSPAEPQGAAEWMETKTWVDMHAKAEQSSETVQVAQGGLKVQVKARDNRWIQVTDPKSATTGWIYDRFLKPADAPEE